MIKEDHVSFEVAKLLKEKGFDERSAASYDLKGELKEGYANWNKAPIWYAAPTHQMAIKWLREIYDLHIIAYPFKSGNDTSTKHYCCQVFKTFNLLGYEKYTNETLTSYEEAIEAALKYALENLMEE